MRVVLTGAGTRAGAALVPHLDRHEVIGDHGVGLLDADSAAGLLRGADAIVHAAMYSPSERAPGLEGGDLIDFAARGTFVLLREALKAGVRRVVMVSRLDLMSGHPAEAVVTEHWRPLPESSAEVLAAYCAELTLREICRAEEITGVCLRFEALSDAVARDMGDAVDRALTMDLGDRKHRWWVYHVSTSGRLLMDAAAQPPLCFSRSEGGADAAGA
jgi:nucleoside-diphosphate-sugar epimerase